MENLHTPTGKLPTIVTPYTTIFSNLGKACSEIDLNTVKILLGPTQDDIDPNEHFGQKALTALHICLSKVPLAYLNGRFQSVPDGFNFIHLSRIIDLLLLHGADPLALDINGETPLHYSVRHSGHFPFLKQILHEHPHLDVNIKDVKGRTPLWWSCYRGHRHASLLLIQHGADVDMSTNKGFTVLHLPISADDVHFFVAYGAKLNTQSVNRFTPLHEAVYMIDSINTNSVDEYDFLVARLRAILSYFPSLSLLDKQSLKAEELNRAGSVRSEQVRRIFELHHMKVVERRVAFSMGLFNHVNNTAVHRHLPDEILPNIVALSEQ